LKKGVSKNLIFFNPSFALLVLLPPPLFLFFYPSPFFLLYASPSFWHACLTTPLFALHITHTLSFFPYFLSCCHTHSFFHSFMSCCHTPLFHLYAVPTLLHIPYLFYTNKLVQKHNENVFIKTLSHTFIFKAMAINHKSCPPSYKLSNDPSKIVDLHSTNNILKNMLVELCVGNYATSYGFVNEVDGIFKASTTYCETTKISLVVLNKSHAILVTNEW